MSLIHDLLAQLPLYLLSIPVLLMSFSVHESAHGYVAWRLGDPTARNLGRITLNPLKHLDPIGTICMIVAHVGWAKPVPINGRYFKKPKRDWALTGAAGPLSNLALALIHLAALRLMVWIMPDGFTDELVLFWYEGTGPSAGFTVYALVMYVLYLGIAMNISLAIFNLIPIPPFDGSRIFYAFLPAKWYFGIMKYERWIMLGFLILFWAGFLSGPLAAVQGFITNGLLTLVGLGETNDGALMNLTLNYVVRLATVF